MRWEKPTCLPWLGELLLGAGSWPGYCSSSTLQHSDADTHGDRSHTSGVSWFVKGARDVGGVGRRDPNFHFIPLLGAVSHGRGPAVLPLAVLGPRSGLQDAG